MYLERTNHLLFELYVTFHNMSAQQKFKTGDRVILNSGGPVMTVVKYEPENGEDVICQWFYSNKLEEKAFNQNVIELYITPSFF